MSVELLQGDCIEVMQAMEPASVHCVVTSPPYWGLRDYGVDGQIGLEATPEEWVAKLVDVFRAVKRVLRPDGTVWLNLGDSYVSTTSTADNKSFVDNREQAVNRPHQQFITAGMCGLKPKNLIGQPWRVAFALQDDGWYLRSDIIWHKCLSGGAWVYGKTRKGVMPIMVKDLHRLQPGSVDLWSGEAWTRCLGVSKQRRTGKEIELLLRSGERISCTLEHKWPTRRGLVEASELKVGDKLKAGNLPDQKNHAPGINLDAAWFIGLYIAEGSRSEDTVQIAGHKNETARLERIKKFAKRYGCHVAYTFSGNKLDIRIYGRFANYLIDQYVSGRTAKDKGVKVVAWQHSNDWLQSLLDGYLSGDGHKEKGRWRLGFTRNYNLERDLRILSARLGATLTLKTSTSTLKEKVFPSFRGEIRLSRSGHRNEKDRFEIMEIRKSRARFFYDICVEDDPHLFSLASGVLTHNSNPMPESCTDRPTKSHEYIFLLAHPESKGKYYYDADAIREPHKKEVVDRYKREKEKGMSGRVDSKYNNQGTHHATKGVLMKSQMGAKDFMDSAGRNKRTVWTVPTAPYSEAHFATYPPALIKPCILAGCPEGGTVLDPFGGSGTTGEVAEQHGRNSILIELNPEYIELQKKRTAQGGLFA